MRGTSHKAKIFDICAEPSLKLPLAKRCGADMPM
jgi:hypothetical protein